MALQPNSPSRYVKAIQYESMTDLLTHFRQQLERENGKPISELSEVNAAMLLSDLCVSWLVRSKPPKDSRCRSRSAYRSDIGRASRAGNLTLSR
jgi:hypothetical protein